MRIAVEEKALIKVAQDTRALIAVSNAFRGAAVEHAVVVGGLTESEIRLAWEPYRWGRRDIDPMLTRMKAGTFEVLTRRRDELVDDETWYRSRLVNEFFRPLAMDQCIQSEVQLPGGVVHRLAFARPWGAKPLGPEDEARIHHFHQVLLKRWRFAAAVTLEPRTRAVLEGLVAGRSEKQIADGLGLARSSIDREVQTIYRCYQVHSRAELLAVARGLRVPPEMRQAVRALSPRQRQTVALLLTGLAERDIACVVGVSYNTLHQYVKSTYRALGIQSRPELVARLSQVVALDDEEWWPFEEG